MRVDDATGLFRRQIIYIRARVLVMVMVMIMLLLLLLRHDDSLHIRI